MYAGQEHKVKESIERRVKAAGLESLISGIFVPPQEKTNWYRISHKIYPFPNFILVEMEATSETRQLILGTPGVVDFVNNEGNDLLDRHINSLILRSSIQADQETTR